MSGHPGCQLKSPLLWSEVKWNEVKVAQLCLTLCDSIDCIVHGILQARILDWAAFPFSRRIFPTQESNPGLRHCGQILYQLSHKGSPRIREWVAYPCSRGSSQPGNQTRVSCIAGGFFANELAGKPLLWSSSLSWVRVPPTWQGWPGFQVTSKLCGQQGWQTASPHLGICVLLLPLSK